MNRTEKLVSTEEIRTPPSPNGRKTVPAAILKDPDSHLLQSGAGTASSRQRFNLLSLPLLRRLLTSRWPQLALTLLALAGFVLAILSGLVGTPVGSRSFAIIFVWIAWWALLMLVAVPFLGRAWCSVCPIPMPGEYLQRGAVLGPVEGKTGYGLGWRWPKALRNIWLQNAAFALVAVFSTVILTQPRLTSIILLVFLFAAIGASLLFERRAFCRYLCPVGGFIGLYSQFAPLEVRVIDSNVCAGHAEKTCYTGSQSGYGCPWQVFPLGLVKNTYCGMCMECLRTCPHENIAINLRAFGDDLSRTQHRRLDEVYKAFIMLGSALLYSAVLLGPWGALKAAAYSVLSLPWLAYAAVFLVVVLAVLPGIFLLAVWLGHRLARSTMRLKKAYTSLAYCLVPLGLAFWMAFSLSFVFANFSYLWRIISDPFGWGWNLFGTAGAAWQPYLMSYVPYAQAAILIAGLAWAGKTAKRTAEEALSSRPASLQAAPVVAFCLAITTGMLFLLVA
jgi:polyferredoxin